jgi:competence protein ComEA
MPMDSDAPWRALETAETALPAAQPDSWGSRGHRLMLGAAAVVVTISVIVAVLVASRQSGQLVVSGPEDSATTAGEIAAPTQPMLVVEVAGAVAHPGIYSLPAGSRVADAIRAAGGYSADVDPRAAEAQLNLAAKLQDAQLVRVPRRGDAASSPAALGSGAGSSSATGPLNLNTATAEQLDALPGIGPVTAQKIIAAREQKPFAKVDDLVTRKLVSAATLAKLRSLVTVG